MNSYRSAPQAVAQAKPNVDRTLSALMRGYRFLPGLRNKHRADYVELRLLGERVLCVSGVAGARLFYDETRMRRKDAIPGPLADLLFGRGAIHGLDGAEHEHRKAMFLSLLDEAKSRDLAQRTVPRWQQVFADKAGQAVSVFDLAVDVLGGAAYEWAGIPSERVPAATSYRLASIVDGFGSVGPRHLRGRIARARADRWAAGLIRDVRTRRLTAPENSPLSVVAHYVGPDGAQLPDHTAGVELLNLLRPTVAVAWLIDYAALALHRDPHAADRLRDAPDEHLEAFALEVRRRCPFVPALGARAKRDFEWHGRSVAAGQLVLLDVYGTDHDPGRYPDPERFDPARFLAHPPGAYDYLPHGGGPPAGHRCPGERVAIEAIKEFVRVLLSVGDTRPEQQLRMRLSRMPARVAGGVRICPSVRDESIPRAHAE